MLVEVIVAEFEVEVSVPITNCTFPVEWTATISALVTAVADTLLIQNSD